MPKEKAEWQVRVQTDLRDKGQTFGPFDKRNEAEQCCIALAAKPGVKAATIEEIE